MLRYAGAAGWGSVERTGSMRGGNRNADILLIPVIFGNATTRKAPRTEILSNITRHCNPFEPASPRRAGLPAPAWPTRGCGIAHRAVRHRGDKRGSRRAASQFFIHCHTCAICFADIGRRIPIGIFRAFASVRPPHPDGLSSPVFSLPPLRERPTERPSDRATERPSDRAIAARAAAIAKGRVTVTFTLRMAVARFKTVRLTSPQGSP
ncbi:hypothetical protein [Burkholderia thailandensis]|uniref:hypothetical protein n=1 Tax=Burkholderia thailandensis TaxID=57975 RepID=UPI000FD6969A|nr:hypothetical protein [Burkholderia thailandensis]NBC91188.1 hypothetical protein [Burkholderia thailandensis]